MKGKTETIDLGIIISNFFNGYFVKIQDRGDSTMAIKDFHIEPRGEQLADTAERISFQQMKLLQDQHGYISHRPLST